MTMNWWADSIKSHFPPASIFDPKQEITDSELFRFARIILTEGTPFACAKFPMAFEFARGKAAEILGVHPKQLSLIGSARIGYSLAGPKFGRPFDLQASDIDLFVVSRELFGLLCEEHKEFLNAWRCKKIQPRHEIQSRFWDENARIDDYNIRRGFLDASHIPTYDMFPVSKMFGEAAYKFHVNLEAAVSAKIGRKASIRSYKDWDAAIRQIAFTLRRNLEDLGFVVGAKAAAKKGTK